MAGYTRQSAPDIINGAEVTAPPLIAEFNQIESAFSGTTGHSHDGSTGNSLKINLQTSVSGYLLPANGGTGGQNNVQATSNPTITDDVNAGYAPGNIWLNTSTNRFFVCAVNTASAAVWHEIVANTGTSITPETTNTVDIGSSSLKYKDLHLEGNALMGGTLGVSGLSTLASLNSTTSTLGSVTVGGSGNNGSINGVVIGSTNPTGITGTTITANNGFTGNLTGDVAGNVTASSGTSTFNNTTINGTLTASLTGNVAGDVTSSGTSTFNNVTVSGTLNMDGGTTATIQNLSAPVNANDAARKVDVDTAVSNLVDSSPAALDTLNELAAAINDDAGFSTTITNSIATKLPLAGGTMAGAIAMGTNKVTGVGDPTNVQDVSTKNYTDTQDATKLNLSGGTMSGVIAMGNNAISGLPTPLSNDQATSKAYVDGILGSANNASASATASANSAAAALASENAASGHATTAQSAIVSSQQFLDTYFVSANAPTGASVTLGDLWFDTTANQMKVFGSGGFQSAGSSVNGTAERKDYTVGTNSGSYSGSLTTFPAVYDPTFCDVYLNGIKLAPSDFTATDGANVVLASGAATGDSISIVSFGTFSLADHYNKTQVDAFIDDVETLALAGI
jgi:hypothetical protein